MMPPRDVMKMGLGVICVLQPESIPDLEISFATAVTECIGQHFGNTSAVDFPCSWRPSLACFQTKLPSRSAPWVCSWPLWLS